jgi:hypothetical protein
MSLSDVLWSVGNQELKEERTSEDAVDGLCVWDDGRVVGSG